MVFGVWQQMEESSFFDNNPFNVPDKSYLGGLRELFYFSSVEEEDRCVSSLAYLLWMPCPAQCMEHPLPWPHCMFLCITLRATLGQIPCCVNSQASTQVPLQSHKCPGVKAKILIWAFWGCIPQTMLSTFPRVLWEMVSEVFKNFLNALNERMPSLFCPQETHSVHGCARAFLASQKRVPGPQGDNGGNEPLNQKKGIL